MVRRKAKSDTSFAEGQDVPAGLRQAVSGVYDRLVLHEIRARRKRERAEMQGKPSC